MWHCCAYVRLTNDVLRELGVEATDCADFGGTAVPGAVCARLEDDFDTVKRSVDRAFKSEPGVIRERSKWWRDPENGWMVRQAIAGTTMFVVLFDGTGRQLTILRDQTCFDPAVSDDGSFLIPGEDGVSDLVKIKTVDPVYPHQARTRRVSGSTMLQAIIDADGRVANLCVVNCSRPGLGFEKAAHDAVKEWRYSPATRDGVPVPVVFLIYVDFVWH